MYPHTTALYCATVIDNTTYCRNQDDIIVVEFDGDEGENDNMIRYDLICINCLNGLILTTSLVIFLI